MADVIEVTVLDDGTTSTTPRAFTVDELNQREADQLASAAAAQDAEAAALSAAAEIAAAQDELKDLGLSDRAVAAISGHPYPRPAP